MTARSVRIELKINFPLILFIVLVIHALLLAFETLTPLEKFAESRPETTPLKIRDIRTVGSRESKVNSSTYLSKNPTQSKTIAKDRFAPNFNKGKNEVITKEKPPLSFKDLSPAKQITEVKPKTAPQIRPGTRPEVTTAKKAISAIKLNGQQMKQFAASNAASLSGDPRAASLSNSDILVNLEVPEGVNPDELNDYELMFYSFQRRTAINYINSFYKNLDKFERENPHLQFPLTNDKQVMTGRLTYDEKGNLKQIKMIRWSNIDKLQDFFVDVLKNMDTLHNPPQALWKRDGEFSIFFSLVING
ncbi:MAG: hypothetical protein AB7I27_17385 [Bacteriovoracaceae bacterium]